MSVVRGQLVGYPNGAVTPVQTPEVQAAEAQHFAAYANNLGTTGLPASVVTAATSFAEASLAGSPYAGAGYANGAGYLNGAAGYANGGAGYLNGAAGYANGAAGYANGGAGYLNGAAGYANGAAGFANGGIGYANGAAGYLNGAAGYTNGAGYPNGAFAQSQLYNNYNPALVGYPNGAVVPVDEPAVQAARAEHFAALGLAGATNGYATNGYATNGYASGFGGLVGYPNGAVVPVDEPAVQAARAQHLAAYNYAG